MDIIVPKTSGVFSVKELPDLFSKANRYKYNNYLGQAGKSFAEIIGRDTEITEAESQVCSVDVDGKLLIEKLGKLKASQAMSVWEIYWIFRGHLERAADFLRVIENERHVVNLFPIENQKTREFSLISIDWEPEDHYCDRNSSAGAGDIWHTDPAKWSGYVYRDLEYRHRSDSIFGDSWSRKGRLFLKKS